LDKEHKLMTEKLVQGTPPLSLFPAKNYVFKVSDEHYVIRIPRKGNYHELAPDIFDEAAGEFNVFDEQTGIMFLPSISKILFATKKYPDLKFNQFFVPYSLFFEGDDEVLISGQVVDMMLIKNDNTSTGEADNELH
jgi:hypothetical protein